MPKIRIDGVGVVNVDDSFLDLSPEEQNETIEEIVREAKRSSPTDLPEKKYDWVSDVTGSIGALGGGILGAIGGTAIAPGAGTVAGGVAGSASGGAAGGAFGEWLEGKLDPERGRRTGEIFDTALTEGAWGLIPGVGGAATKTTARAGSRLVNILTRPFGGAIKLPSDYILTGLSKLSPRQKKALASSYMQRLTDAGLKPQAGQEYIRVIMDGTKESVSKFFKKHRGEKDFERVVELFYAELVRDGIWKGAMAEPIARAAHEIYREEKGYKNQGGLISRVKDIR